MSPGGYDASPLLSSATRHDSRRTSSTIHSAYDRPFSLVPHRRSPSPGPTRRYMPYDSYVPPRAAPLYQDNYPNVYRPVVYRTNPAVYCRSPSPTSGRFERLRGRELDHWDPEQWDRSMARLPSNTPSAWQDRRPVPSSPTSRDRVRSDTIMATRMFEPSNAWKQTQVDRPVRVEASRSSPIDRYSENRIRDSRDLSPERSVRYDHSPPYYPVGGDRYRPYRDVYLNGRSEYDSYRPQYGDAWVASHTREPPSVIDSYRRDPNSTPSARSSSHYDYTGRHPSSPDRSLTGSISPRSRPRSPPFRSRPSISRRDTSRGRRSISYTDRPVHNGSSGAKPRWSFVDADELSQNNTKSRSSSRSSIASTHVSDNPPSPPRNDPSSHPQPQSDNVPPGGPNPIAMNGSATKESELQHFLPPICPSKSPVLVVDTLHSANHIKKEPLSCPASLDLGTKLQKPDVDMSKHTPTPQPLPEATKASKVLSKEESNATTQTSDVHKQSMLSSQTLSSDAKTDSPQSQSSLKSSLVPTTRSSDVSSLTRHHNHTDTCESRLPSTEIPMSVDQPPNLEAEYLSATGFPITSESQLSTPVDVKEGITTMPLVPIEPVVDFPPEDIPKLSDAKSTAEALRTVVMTRLLCDRQTREERVNPVLMANLSISRLSDDLISAPADNLISDFVEGERLHARMDSFTSIKPSLVKRFAEHQAAIAEKAQRLREEYMSLHERWLIHCATLNDQAKPGASESEAVPTSGRTTRRSTANLGDAVRSDLEMEQIIASLGNDELTDPSQLSARNLAVIPDMISVTHGQVDYVYDDTNHILKDPSDFYGPHTGIHDWTEKEKEIFLDKFAAYPKQFGIIADYLPNKTASQCIDFYYLHKKMFIDFRKVVAQYAPNKRRRRRTDGRKGNGLLADIRQHDAEVHRGSTSTNGRTTRARNGKPPPIVEPRKPALSRRATAHLGLTPTSTPTPEPEARPKRSRAIQLSRRTVSVSQDDGEEHSTDAEPRVVKRVKRGGKLAKPAAVVVEEGTVVVETKSVDQAESTNRRKPPPLNMQWSDEDKNLFLALLAQHGDDFKRIAASMPNKTTIQVSYYYKRNLVDLNLEKVAAGAPKRSATPEPRDSWKDISHYPGSGIMSPVSGASPDPGPTIPSLETPHSKDGISPPRRMQIHELLSAPSGDPRPPSIPWPSSTGIGRDMASTSGIRVGVTEPVIPYHDNVGDGVGIYSPNQSRSRVPATHPLPTSRSSGNYAPASVSPPSLAPIQTKPSPRGQSMLSYDSHQGPSCSSFFDANSASHQASHRPSSLASSNRGENPYPVVAASHAAASPFFFP